MDTLNSPAVMWIEGLIKYLSRWRSLPGWKKVIPELERVVKELKFSYTDDISPYVEKLLTLLDTLTADGETGRWVKYVKEEVADLPRKLKVPVTEPYGVFRYRFVEVESTRKHPSLELVITTVRDEDGRLYTVVTNREVKRGVRALIVMLPPRRFGDVWSEAMYVKSNVRGPQDISHNDLTSLNRYYSEVVGWT